MISIVVIIVNIGFFFYTWRKLYKSKSDIINNKSILVLRNILKEINKNDTLQVSSERIILALQRYYKVNFVTVYLKEHGKYKVLESNLKAEELKLLGSEVREWVEVLERDNNIGEIKKSKTGLTYSGTRNIKYSNFMLIKTDDTILGAIHIENMHYPKILDSDFFDVILESISSVFKTMIIKNELRDLGIKDGLTGLYNKRYINNTLDNKIVDNEEFYIAIMDIDHFKQVNDTYGHNHGDKVLKESSELIQENLCGNDLIMRWGGEEFLILLNKTSEEEAYESIEKVRILIERSDIGITASFGLVSSKDSSNTTELVEKADKALYRSKEEGRNKTTIFKDK